MRHLFDIALVAVAVALGAQSPTKQSEVLSYGKDSAPKYDASATDYGWYFNVFRRVRTMKPTA